MLRVEDAQGVVLEQRRPSPTRQALTANAARMITDVLADNEARTPFYGSHSLLQLGSRPVAAKTGTTTDNRDAWTIGYTPSLAAGVWVGNSDHAPMKEDATGTTAAAPIWNAFMRRALSGAPVESFTPPEIPLTGKPVLDGELEGEAAWAEGTGDGAEEGTARAHGLARRPAGPYTLASLARAAAPPRP
jgi:membrane peptidoglycan carboxypeptidase